MDILNGIFISLAFYPSSIKPSVRKVYCLISKSGADLIITEGIAYIHIVDHSAMGAPEVPRDMKRLIRGIFKNTIILSGGYDLERAEADKIGYTDYPNY